jgi:HrpA-like RNA helicase
MRERFDFLPDCCIAVAKSTYNCFFLSEDVVVVIDSGRERELRRHQRTSTSVLVTDWASKASAKQRAGRAGRVQPGICLKLYSSETAKSMKASQEPELKRISLEQVCLLILSSHGFGDCESFLRQAPQPPREESIQTALVSLREVGATTSSGKGLTPLGQHLARLPVDVRIGKLLIMGALFNCMDSSLTIAAALSSKSPFATHFDDAELAKAKQALFKDSDSGSDFITLCNVWEGFAKARTQSFAFARTFCKSYYLDHTALTEISSARNEFLSLLSSAGFVSKDDADTFGTAAWDTCVANLNSKKWPVVHSVACAGLSPNFARLDTTRSSPRLYQNQQEIAFHKSSINAGKKRFRSDQQWVVFHDKFSTSGRVSVSISCFVSPLPLLLFGRTVRVEHTKRMVVIDDWIEIPMPAQTAVTLVQLRTQIDALLERLISNTHSIDTNLMNEITQILQ